MRTSVELRAVWSERRSGVLVAAVGVLVAQLLSAWVPGVGVVTAAVVLGVLVGNLPGGTGAAGPGLAWVARAPLRAGVVLLGLQLAVGQVLGLGAATLGVVVAVVVVGVLGTVLIGRALGLPPGLSVLVAVGSSICGASAIAAVEGVVEREDEDVAAGVAMVTVFGTLLVVLVPLVGSAWGWVLRTWGGSRVAACTRSRRWSRRLLLLVRRRCRWRWW
ncbi:putative sulfate exporter family transporter [Saccharopolyspora gregorii]